AVPGAFISSRRTRSGQIIRRPTTTRTTRRYSSIHTRASIPPRWARHSPRIFDTISQASKSKRIERPLEPSTTCTVQPHGMASRSGHYVYFRAFLARTILAAATFLAPPALGIGDQSLDSFPVVEHHGECTAASRTVVCGEIPRLLRELAVS